MHQNNCSVSQIAVIHNAIVIQICIQIFPVQTVNRPQNKRFPNCRNNFIIAVSIRRTNYRGLLSTGINQCLIGIAEFLYNIINTQIQHIQMIPGMVSDLTAKFHHSLHFVRILSNQLSQHKEGSMCIVLLQTVQKLVCILSRTIIKGKCDQRTFLLSIVRTILIKIVIVYPLGHPAGLHVSIGIKCIFHSVNLCKTIGIICTICVLIPTSAGILMPAWSQ